MTCNNSIGLFLKNGNINKSVFDDGLVNEKTRACGDFAGKYFFELASAQKCAGEANFFRRSRQLKNSFAKPILL